MCGIVGSINVSNKGNDDILLESISHRGPDSFGKYREGNLFLGHTRLAIQDLSENGNQPMFSEDGRYIIVFNGEIYNHLEIRAQIGEKYNYRSTGDTETVLYSFIEYGVNCLNLFNGIFSMAIYDNVEKNLFLARDHFGVKPLYYYQDEDQFLFSSEIKSLIETNICKDLDSAAILNYLTFLWSPGVKTPFLKVHKLLPGHYLKFHINEFDETLPVKYYEPQFNGVYSAKSECDLVDELEMHLVNAVKRQMLSDVPVGFFLSGGLDSTLLVAIAKKLYPSKIFSCFTIDLGCTDDKFDGFVNDIDYARKAASFLDVDLHVVKGEIDIINNFDKMIWHLDEPQADFAPLHVLNIATLAKQHGIKVLIGGAGGDDIFSGYRRHEALNYEKYFKLMPAFVGKAIKYIIHKIPSDLVGIRRLKKLTEHLDMDSSTRMKGYFQWIDPKIIKSIFTPSFAAKIVDYDPVAYFDDLLCQIPKEKNLLNQMLFWELKTFLVDHNLNYTDKMAMAVGVEARVPYLDRDLVHFSQTLPPELKMKGNTAKYLLKKVAERYLPKDIIYRPKTGFGAPIRKWIIEDMKSFLEDELSEIKIKKNGIFNYTEVQKLMEDNRSGKIDASYTILAVLAVTSWANQFHLKVK
jgi:asparagine synthase (glutamine-hydrolysing)